MCSFLIARLTASISFPRTQIQLGTLVPQNAFLFFNPFTSGTFSDSDSDSERNHDKDDAFTVSYLINSCGLSAEVAKKLSEKVKLRNPNGPNAVLGLLKNYGFSETQIAKLVEIRPIVLVSKEKTLLPKLKFFHSIGFSSTDLPKLLLRNSPLLLSSLRNCLIPRYKVIKSVLRDKGEVVTAINSDPRSFTNYDLNDLVPNMKVLRQFGVPQGSISFLVCHHPRVAYMKHSKFVEAVEKAKEMGFDPKKVSFVVAVEVLMKINEAMWESRLEAFERWGWSRDVSLFAFKRYPGCMRMSEMKIMKSMGFLVQDMGLPSEEFARTPAILAYNLEKRIIPRCKVVKILKSKGLVKNDISTCSFIIITENNFLKRFVTRFQENVPLLLQVYQGEIDYLDIL